MEERKSNMKVVADNADISPTVADHMELLKKDLDKMSITDLKETAFKATKALKESEEKFAALMNQSRGLQDAFINIRKEHEVMLTDRTMDTLGQAFKVLKYKELFKADFVTSIIERIEFILAPETKEEPSKGV